MRAYLPLMLSELDAPTPPSRPAVVATLDPALTRDEAEEALEDVLDEASYESLELVHKNSAYPRRVVAVAEVANAVQPLESWAQFQSLMVDGDEAGELISALMAETDQERADSLINALFDHPLFWHDISEKGVITQA